jgi:hypothetical protein
MQGTTDEEHHKDRRNRLQPESRNRAGSAQANRGAPFKGFLTGTVGIAIASLSIAALLQFGRQNSSFVRHGGENGLQKPDLRPQDDAGQPSFGH